MLGTAAVMEGRKTLAEGRTSVDPAHQMVGGGLRVAVGEIEQGQLLLGITSDIHKVLKDLNIEILKNCLPDERALFERAK